MSSPSLIFNVENGFFSEKAAGLFLHSSLLRSIRPSISKKTDPGKPNAGAGLFNPSAMPTTTWNLTSGSAQASNGGTTVVT